MPASSTDDAEVASPTRDPPPAIAVLDPGGAIVVADCELERQFGYTRDEIVGQSLALLLPEVLLPVATSAVAPALPAGGTGVGHELVGRRKDESRFAVDVRWNHLPTRDGSYLIASIVNVAESRRREDARRAASREQQEFERLIAELFVQFINVPEDQLAATIGSGLRAVCEHLGVDRGTFLRIESEDVLVIASSWTAPGFVSEHWPVSAAQHFPWTTGQVLAGKPVIFTSVEDIPSVPDRVSFSGMGSQSAVYLPLSVQGRVAGAVGFATLSAAREWPLVLRRRFDLIGALFTQALARQQRDDAMRAALLEVQQLSRQVGPAVPPREGRNGRSPVVGQSIPVRRVLDQIQQVAATDSTVLLLGETGTGKEMFAAQIHEHSTRAAHAMVKVSCAAIPPTLIESELFGREKGAFTGALGRQIGRFELADHSTIFLDEIGDLPAEVQVKLLRVLEERTIERLGSPRPIIVDVRIIAATHRNLEQRVADGSFREDLYYRLNVFPIRVPPLRERVDDIPLLVWHFVAEFSSILGKRVDAIDKDAMAALQQYPWPGNVRELRNVVERAMIVSTGSRLVIPSPQPSAAATRSSPKLADVEKEHIRTVLESTGWRIRGSGGAADRLGLKPTTLETRMAKLGLHRPGHA